MDDITSNYPYDCRLCCIGLGDIPPSRVPCLGCRLALRTVQDVIDIRNCVTGVCASWLMGRSWEKGMGYKESLLVGAILWPCGLSVLPR